MDAHGRKTVERRADTHSPSPEPHAADQLVVRRCGALMKSRASLATRCLIPTESVTVTDHIYLIIIILYKSLQCQL
jgi:hypothetical protein